MSTSLQPKPISDRIPPPGSENYLIKTQGELDRQLSEERAFYEERQANPSSPKPKPITERMPPPGPESEIVFSPG